MYLQNPATFCPEVPTHSHATVVTATVIHHGHITGPFTVDRLSQTAARLAGGHALTFGAELVIGFQHAALGPLPIRGTVTWVCAAPTGVEVALRCPSFAALRLLEFVELLPPLESE